MSLYAEQMRYVLACIEAMDALDERLDAVKDAIKAESGSEHPLYIRGPIQIVDTYGDVHAVISSPDGLGWELST
jgi:hypothetical protein